MTYSTKTKSGPARPLSKSQTANTEENHMTKEGHMNAHNMPLEGDEIKMTEPEVIAGTDRISVLHSAGPRLTKKWKADGGVQQYDNALQFKLEVVTVDGIKALSALLTELEDNPRACIIRGCYVGGERAAVVIERARAAAAAAKDGKELKVEHGNVLRRKELFDDQRLHMVLIEVDKYQSTVDPIADPEAAIRLFIDERLPRAFRDATCHWQLSSSAGHASKGGELRAHLWFWLKTPYSSEELRAWARHEKLEIDAAVFRQVQIHYTARPVFEAGVADPVSRRSGLMQSPFDLDEVDLDLGGMLAARQSRLAEAAAEAARKRAERAARDPEGASIVEAFNARHSIADLFLEHGFDCDGLDNWHWEKQSTESYATRIFYDNDGERWVSLSGTVASEGIGFETKSGARAGDAFDLLVHFTHKGNWATAMAAASVAMALDDFEDISNDPEILAYDKQVEAEREADARRRTIMPTPYVLQDPWLLPRRQWIYGHHLIRKFVSATIAPGGVGKSALEIVDALAMATGRTLVGDAPRSRLKVWIWNGEDPLDELDRRIAGACLHYGITRADLEGYLFVDSGRDTEIVIAQETRDGTVISKPVVKRMIEVIRALGIDAVIIDPFVSSHRVSENDNNAIDRVIKTWGQIADATNCAISLVHHTRKGNGGEITADDARGASSLKGAVRRMRTVNVMTATEAEKAGITDGHRRYFYVDDSLGKNNMSPPATKRDWYRLTSVDLGNSGSGEPSDNIGVVTIWEYKTASAGVPADQIKAVMNRIATGGFRASDRSPMWAGNAIAAVLELDPKDRGKRDRIRQHLADWVAAGYLVQVERKDENRETRIFIEVGGQEPPVVDLDVEGELET